MTERHELLAAISFNDAVNAGSTPEQLVDAYRAAVLREAAQIAEGQKQYELGLSRRNSRKQSAENVGITRVVADLRRMSDEAATR
ncbi:hypothetical protein ACFYNN_12995 [Streptomyces sp. NPDC006978]|uniref:hypothetical protein n=1 Tax=Streptomyces sp. NPDC006978 TaxID=3364769 RepID=UPI0036A55C2E